jgi:L-amino acid N-acyltransferase YncA
VRNTTISFEEAAPDAEQMRGRIANILERFPWLVAEDGGVLGYAYGSQHRARAAYRWSVDVSVYVSQDARRRGIGRMLYAELIPMLRAQGFYNAFAGIALPNDASIGIHRAFGFEPIGVYRNVGYKNGRWHDVSWWQLQLREPAPNPSEPRAPTLAE